jgi:hypothetical protein
MAKASKKKSTETPTTETPTVETPSLSPEQILRAATNDPALSKDTIALGNKTFKVVDLKYDDYLTFITYLSPLLDAIAKSMLSLHGQSDEPEKFSTSTLFSYCGKELPEMARIVCAQTEPDITAEEIKELAGTPFKLIDVVWTQIVRNKMIDEIAAFFGRMAALLSQTTKR